MLAVIGAVALIAMLVLAFTLLYLSMLRSNTEHKTAIEAAAIAAAKDVSRIVVDTPEWGYVGLSNEPAIRNYTRAGDNWDLQVRSINELTATARVNMIIASQLNGGDTFMQQCASEDMNAVIRAKNALVTEINQALVSGGSARDAAGNTVTPYASAQQAYSRNEAKNSTYVANSLNLTLGGLQGGIPTSTKIPNPASYANAAGKEAEGYYLSDTNIQFGGEDFVFGAVGKRVSLCDVKKFTTTVSGIPYQVPAVVRAQATQRFTDQGKTWDTSFNACACAGSLEQPRPAPGALTVSFPDGPPPEITRLSDLYTHVQMGTTCPLEILTSANGDFLSPGASLVPYPEFGPGQYKMHKTAGSIPFSASTSPPKPFAAEVVKLAIYDWIRCAGSNANIQSVLAEQNRVFAMPSPSTIAWKTYDPSDTTIPRTVIDLGQIPKGIMHIFKFQPDGTVNYSNVAIMPQPYTPVGEGQLYAELQDAGDFASSVPIWGKKGIQLPYAIAKYKGTADVTGTQSYNVFVRDLARNLGKDFGGSHAGERMDGNANISYGPHGLYGPQGADGDYGSGGWAGALGTGLPPTITRQDDFGSTNIPPPPFYKYSQGPGGGGPRPAYTKTSLAADIRFRRLVHVGDLEFLIGGSDYGFIGEIFP